MDDFDVRSLQAELEIGDLAERGTDLDNSAFFSRRAKGRLLFNFVARSWMVFDGKRWRFDDDGSTIQYAKDAVREMQQLAVKVTGDEQRAKALKRALELQSRKRIEAMLFLSQSDLPIAPQAFNRDLYSFNVLNGTLDLRTRELRTHEASDLITKIAPAEYDPLATCPRWLQFVREIMQNDLDLVDFLQRFVGLCLTGVVIDHLLAIFYGGGSNGKTTLLELLNVLLGDYGTTADPSLFAAARDSKGPSPELVRLHGTRFVAASELPEGGRLSESLMKRLTGGDVIPARDLYSGVIEIVPTWKIAIATNHRPVVRDNSDGFWRRLHLIPFDAIFAGAAKDDRLLEKLIAELPGILNWALDGCDRWQKHGLNEPGEVTSATSAYRAESDVIGAFITDRCVIGSHAIVRAKPLYAAFVEWSRENGERPSNARTFIGEMRRRSFSTRKSHGDTVLSGLGLRDINRAQHPDDELNDAIDEGIDRRAGAERC